MCRWDFTSEKEICLTYCGNQLSEMLAAELLDDGGYIFCPWCGGEIEAIRSKEEESEESEEFQLDMPTTLEECYEILGNWAGPDGVEEFKESSAASYHHNVGRTIRNQWGLWHNPDSDKPETPIHKYLVNLGLHHADDMSGLILESFHRHLLGQPIDVEGQVKKYQEYWAEKEGE